jgi:hypothetical protein
MTELVFNGTSTDNTVGFAYEKLRDVGVFTKGSADTAIKLTWTGHVTTNGTFCDYQLRIDGVVDNPATTGTGRAVSYAADAPVGVTAVFGHGVAAGNRTVEIWLRGLAASCTLNFGNFPMTVVVEEMQLSPDSVVTSADVGDVPEGTG